MGDRKLCICCGKDIVGKPVELNPPDSQMALCRPCNTAQKASPAARDNQGAADG